MNLLPLQPDHLVKDKRLESRLNSARESRIARESRFNNTRRLIRVFVQFVLEAFAHFVYYVLYCGNPPIYKRYMHSQQHATVLRLVILICCYSLTTFLKPKQSNVYIHVAMQSTCVQTNLNCLIFIQEYIDIYMQIKHNFQTFQYSASSPDRV